MEITDRVVALPAHGDKSEWLSQHSLAWRCDPRLLDLPQVGIAARVPSVGPGPNAVEAGPKRPCHL